ncbi:Receptor-like serine/threonine-protein kinase SD1-6 [Zea mays]|nr:Receptor-like serine/threonine-protein kinase SD1-6 [Zea mays]AQK58672.1 Receptor-like serine/threonine-protein kinase SD1-6 [Zea mays]AQK58676.1 Receptor-like serine/threonine-protein kinase SD1-6 [Zea mays]AQK58677.1 Receptor-like serine/threonine-protein kinase SD1-6 [Zea mays]AQK58678.1 Receptor-like serine/threonine-protein kinase SD1-6 [Zea mays]
MEPKITDFGMSRLFGLQQSKIITKTCGGTLGYMAPEYLLKGLISVKADIFSLGVIIIEVMTGGRNYPTCEKSCEQFAVDVVGRWRKRLLEEAGRYTPLEKYVEQVETCILIGLMCVDDDPNKRPTTLDIIERLTKVDVTNTDRGPPKTLEAATGLTGHPNLATRSFLDRFRRTIVIGMLKKALKIQDVSQLEQLLAKEVLLELHKIGTNATGNRSFLERLHASITMATLVQALHSLDLDPSAALRMEVLFLALENMRGKNNSRRRSEDVLELEERPEQIRSVLEAGTRARLSDEEHMPSVSVQAEDQAFPKPKLAKVRATAPVCVSAVWLAAGIGFLCGFTLGEMRGLRRTRVHERT